MNTKHKNALMIIACNFLIGTELAKTKCIQKTIRKQQPIATRQSISAVAWKTKYKYWVGAKRF